MKKFKKLIPAFCMLLVSVVMLGSSTFAWFSMNNKVTASGLDVTAKSNTQFLVIANTLTEGKVADTTTVATADLSSTKVGADDNKVLPVSLFDSTNVWYNGEKDTAEANKHKYDDNSAAKAGDWFTANSPKYDAATGTNNVITNVKKVDSTKSVEFGKYVLTYKCYIALAKGSDALKTTIKAKVVSANAGNTELDQAIKVAMTVTQNGGTAATPVNVGTTEVEFKNGTGDFDLTKTDETTNNKFVEVVIYVYIDGFATNVKSQDFQEITGKLSVEFTAVAM